MGAGGSGVAESSGPDSAAGGLRDEVDLVIVTALSRPYIPADRGPPKRFAEPATNKQIRAELDARRMNLSEDGLRTRLKELYRRNDVTGESATAKRVALVELAFEQGWIAGWGPDAAHEDEQAGDAATIALGSPCAGPPSAPAAGSRVAQRAGGSAATGRRTARRRALAGVLLAVAILGATFGHDLLRGEDGASDRNASATVRLPARVLVLIDGSASMGCPLRLREGETCTPALRAGGGRGLTRMGAVTAWVRLGRNDLRHKGDEVGVWSFSSPRGAGAREPRKRKAGLQIDQLLEFTPRAKAPAVRDLYSHLKPPSGGTPLTDALDAGVTELRMDPRARRSNNTLLVLTDGGEDSSQMSVEDFRASRRAAVEAGNPPVRVVIVAVGGMACGKLRAAFAEPGDGECFRAPDEDALPCVSRRVRALIATPQPAQPRDAGTKARARACD